MGNRACSKVVIISNGYIEPTDLDVIDKLDYIICADGGANFLMFTEIIPNMIVGDLDSIDEDVQHHYRNTPCEFIEFDTEEDKTDTHLSLEYSLKHIDCREIIILGALGLRFDHTLANLHLLYNAMRDNELTEDEENAKRHTPTIRIVSEAGEITVTDSRLDLKGEPGDQVFFIPLTDDVGKVECHGLRFPVNQKEILSRPDGGFNNEMIGKKASIKVNQGIMMVVKKSKDQSELLKIKSGPAPVLFTKKRGH